MDFSASEPNLEERVQPFPDLRIDAIEIPSSEEMTTMDFTTSEPNLEERTQPSPDLRVDAEASKSLV